MERKERIFAKALTWQLCGLIMMAVLGFIMTGSWRSAGGLSLASAGLGLISYVIHEKLWAGVSWGRVTQDR
jgi:uncharacterized membrane protein